jgi:hypothetical protein
MTEIHLPITELKKLTALACFADAKDYNQWMTGVMIEVSNESITGYATDRYALGTYSVPAPGLDVASPIYLFLDSNFCKRVNAIKTPKRGVWPALVTITDDSITIDYESVTYRSGVASDIDKRIDQMKGFLSLELAELSGAYSMAMRHFAKLDKLSSEPWLLSRVQNTSNGKLAPVIATGAGYTVLIQPTIVRS